MFRKYFQSKEYLMSIFPESYFSLILHIEAFKVDGI